MHSSHYLLLHKWTRISHKLPHSFYSDGDMPFFYYFRLTQSLTVLNMVNSEFGVFGAIQIPGGSFGPEEMFLSMCCRCSLLTVGLLPHASRPWPWPLCFLYHLLKHLWLEWFLDLLAPTYPCHLVLLWLSNMAYLRLNSTSSGSSGLSPLPELPRAPAGTGLPFIMEHVVIIIVAHQ